MPRIRTIKPAFWLDPDLASVSLEARLTYIGLWNLSDDRGVFEYIPAKIRVQLFPYDFNVTNDNLTCWLQELLQIHNIIRFSEGSKTFGFIPSFAKHQQVQHPSKSYFSLSLPSLTESSVSTHESSENVGREEERGRGGEVEGEKESLQREEKEKVSEPLGRVIKAYEQNFGMVTSFLLDDLTDALKEYGEDAVIGALRKAVENNKRRWTYARAILQNWKVDGVGGNGHKKSGQLNQTRTIRDTTGEGIAARQNKNPPAQS